jgi:hypothetical protein
VLYFSELEKNSSPVSWTPAPHLGLTMESYGKPMGVTLSMAGFCVCHWHLLVIYRDWFRFLTEVKISTCVGDGVAWY